MWYHLISFYIYIYIWPYIIIYRWKHRALSTCIFNLPLICKSMLFLIFWSGSFAVPIGDHFQSGIICGPWSFAVLRSFADPYRSENRSWRSQVPKGGKIGGERGWIGQRKHSVFFSSPPSPLLNSTSICYFSSDQLVGAEKMILNFIVRACLRKRTKP